MGFLSDLFGGSDNMVVTVLLGLGIVIILIVLGLWLLKMLFQATGNVGRGRNRRLSVIDSAAIDQKRQLVLVRRDDVEHLLLIGGAGDVVVETGITPPPELPVRRSKFRPAVVANNDEVTSPMAASSETVVPVTPMAETDFAVEPEPQPRRRSLRDTGLMRPANRQEPVLNPQTLGTTSQFDEAGNADSVKTLANDESEQTEHDGDKDREQNKDGQPA